MRDFWEQVLQKGMVNTALKQQKVDPPLFCGGNVLECSFCVEGAGNGKTASETIALPNIRLLQGNSKKPQGVEEVPEKILKGLGKGQLRSIPGLVAFLCSRQAFHTAC